MLPGQEHQPLRLVDLAPPLHQAGPLPTSATPLLEPRGAALAIAAAGMVRLAEVADRAGETLREHPDPSVRRAAALLAARAHPVLLGLGADA